MNFLFVHNNFPAQFRHIATHLANDPKHTIAAIGSTSARDIPGVKLRRYRFAGGAKEATHPFARSFEVECRRAEQVLYTASGFAAEGFRPDVILVHSGWGECLPLRAVFPSARIITYCEFYYRANGQDVDFDPEFGSIGLDGMTALTARNASGLLALAEADDGLSPTYWQRSTYPKGLQSRIAVIHEGIDTRLARPDAAAQFVLPDGQILKHGDPIVTFVSRNLEPLRGYHVFMRALPHLMRQCPEARVVVVGGDGCSYGACAPDGRSWKEIFWKEIESRIGSARVVFLDPLPYGLYLKLLQVSAVHVYLTYPFVLSWSLLEAMASGCALIASDTAPLQEVLHEDNAILVPFLDSRRLAEAAVVCLRDTASTARRRKNARDAAIAGFDLATRTLPAQLRFLLGD